jgi:predicted DCC family thiol-disulfide oxidoreductase YuxK
VTWTLLYDQDCSFCRVCTAVVLVKDRRRLLRPVPLRDPAATALLPQMDDDVLLASWHLVAPDGREWSGGAAVAPLLRLLPGGGPAASVAERFPGAVDAAYRWTVRHRRRLGRLIPSRAKRWAIRRIAIAQGL